MERQSSISNTDRLPFQQLFENNKYGIIENPLRRIPENHLHDSIRSFYDRADLKDVVDFDTIIRAARLARDEEAFIAEEEAEQTLTRVEKTALGREKETTIWTESREIKIILLTCFVGSILQGLVSEFLPSSFIIEGRTIIFSKQWYYVSIVLT